MLSALGRVVVGRARLILILSVLVFALATALGVGALGKLQPAGFNDPNSPSELAKTQVARFGAQANLLLLVDARAGTVDSPDVTRAATELTRRIGAEPGVTRSISYWTTHVNSLKGRDGREGLVLVSVAGDDKAAGERAKTLIDRYAEPGVGGPVTVRAGGQLGVDNDVSHQVGKDLAFAESIAIPVTMVLLVLAFGGLVAALLPLAIGVLAIVATLAELFVLGSVTDVSVYALNLTTAMGLGLGIDYALLIVNRYREEMRAVPGDHAGAVRRTVATAGRTVLFSGLTVAVAVAALAVFPLYFLRSFAYAGVGVVLVAMLGAIIVLPALLTVLGPRVESGRVRMPRWRGSPDAAAAGPRAGASRSSNAESPFWRRVATVVMRRPVLTGLPVVILLVALGLPFLHVGYGTPDERVLPTSAVSRQVGDAVRTNFGTADASATKVVTPASLPTGPASAYAARLSALPHVARVDGPDGTWVDGRKAHGPGLANTTMRIRGGTLFSVVPSVPAASRAAQAMVRTVRATPPPDGTTALVGGQTASLVDQKHSLARALPYAFALIGVTTLVLLFLFTGSVVLPLKALVLNGLSLTAVFGAMVWVFQDGHLSAPLGFTPSPTTTAIPPLMFCVAFGLSMDYEVFLLSRIKELHQAGASNAEAVAGGLARTGRIVSTAAALLAVSFLAFGTSRVSFIQMFGIGTGIAIVLDATLIRGVLVPSFMRLAGSANWWAPGPLRRLHTRIGLSEAPHRPAAAAAEPTPV